MDLDSYRMEKTDAAEKLFRSGANCAQSVFCAFAPECGFSYGDALKISSGFGGGFGRMREVCGAVSGMTLVCGALHGCAELEDKKRKDAHYALIQKLAGIFRNEFGSIVCRELLNLAPHENDSSVSTVRNEKFYSKRPCLELVRRAAGILAEEFYRN